MKKEKFFTQTILFQTHLFGKNYFWMQDVDGLIYLAKAKEVFEGDTLVGYAPDLI